MGYDVRMLFPGACVMYHDASQIVDHWKPYVEKNSQHLRGPGGFVLFPSCGFSPMETDVIEKMPCHNQQLNNNESPEHAAKHVRFARSSATAETCQDDTEPCENQTMSDIQGQIGPQLKLLPLNDQIRELQTIIRDKWVSSPPFKRIECTFRVPMGQICICTYI